MPNKVIKSVKEEDIKEEYFNYCDNRLVPRI